MVAMVSSVGMATRICRSHWEGKRNTRVRWLEHFFIQAWRLSVASIFRGGSPKKFWRSSLPLSRTDVGHPSQQLLMGCRSQGWRGFALPRSSRPSAHRSLLGRKGWRDHFCHEGQNGDHYKHSVPSKWPDKDGSLWSGTLIEAIEPVAEANRIFSKYSTQFIKGYFWA